MTPHYEDFPAVIVTSRNFLGGLPPVGIHFLHPRSLRMALATNLAPKGTFQGRNVLNGNLGH